MTKKISELTAASTPLAGTEYFEIVQSGVSKKATLDDIPTTAPGRPLLSSATTYYVRTDGSDSNDGLANTVGGAFLTIQKAVDVAAALDNNGYAITITVGTGTFTGAVVLKPIVGAGVISIVGGTADLTSTVISTTSANCFSNGTGHIGTYHLEYMKLQTTTSGYCVDLLYSGVLTFKNVAFGACANSHLSASHSAIIIPTGNYTINGSAQAHYITYDGGNIRALSVTVTLTGTPAFSYSFANSGRSGIILAASLTFSGSATGKRYDATLNSIIYTGGGSTYFPGNVSGTTATGGQYA